MDFTSKKLNTVLLAVITALLATLVFVVAVRSDNPMDDIGNHMGHSSASGNLTGADVMFLQMMIPHHQQAVDISKLALSKSSNSLVLDLARRIESAQASEIATMKKWLNEAGASEDPGHTMTGMGGMLTESDLAALNNATGVRFDRLWLEGMIGHHDGALHMTTMIRDAQNPEIKAFGENIIKVQTSEIKEMEAILSKL